MASTLQQLASSSQWQPSIADHVGLCLERLAQPAEVKRLTKPSVAKFYHVLLYLSILHTLLLLSCFLSLQNVDLSALFGLLVFARFPDVSILYLNDSKIKRLSPRPWVNK